ncbi:DUF998 domain-containing protein [Lysobacter pythonis]|uniref:DUF998 domain-containing protein n=1 Tax=Solilutibacter pythonis TaxID=2483112 RepID=A0A3M2HQ74_9GAMM|nr:DUF998 domain-containing protein [Lysobacter pythonis]RMH91168.1 DUF998 domain-containing protein [Lysobacter pythonis]
MRRWPVTLAAASVLLAALVFGALRPEYGHPRQSLAALGAVGMPGWHLANGLLYLLPGGLMAGLAWHARGRLPAAAGWAHRLALQMALLAALAFVLQGVFALDPTRLPDEGGNRLHALVWLLWSLCFALSTVCMAVAGADVPRMMAALLALAIPSLLVLGPAFGLAGAAQRLLVALWLFWNWRLASRPGAQ